MWQWEKKDWERGQRAMRKLMDTKRGPPEEQLVRVALSAAERIDLTLRLFKLTHSAQL